MNRIVFPALTASAAAPLALAVLLLASSCILMPKNMVLSPDDTPGQAEKPYLITEHKNSAAGEEMPGWMTACIDGGIAGIESLPLFRNSYVFVAKNEGTSFNALNHWMEGFDADLDFPRLAASRIEARFLEAAPLPDQEYGAFFEYLVRSASDYPWKGAVKADDYWIHKYYLHTGENDDKETWEFFILVSINRLVFQSQLEEVFGAVKPDPPLTKDQTNAVNRVKDRFFEGF